MPKIITSGSGTLLPEAERQRAISRRRFLGYGGAATVLAIGLSACNKDDDNDNNSGEGIDLGSGDIGILNYAYALEQLEAAFYVKVITSPYSGITPTETALLTDIRDHEIAHREFFKAALGSSAIQGLTPDFSAINFADRSSVLGAAKTFEDLGVAAYNGAGPLITNGDYLVLAGKIVSVEARHAAYIRDLLSNGSFADSTIINANGLDDAKAPGQVIVSANAFLIPSSRVSGKNLPTA